MKNLKPEIRKKKKKKKKIQSQKFAWEKECYKPENSQEEISKAINPPKKTLEQKIRGRKKNFKEKKFYRLRKKKFKNQEFAYEKILQPKIC